MTTLAPALSDILLTTAEVHAAVMQGQALPAAIQQYASAQQRGAVQDLAYHSMRWHGTALAIVKALTHKPVTPPLLHSLLLVSVSLLLSDDQGPRYEAFTVVDQAVNAAQQHVTLRPAKGMVNAVLRHWLREQKTLLPKMLQQEEASWNYPVWWIEVVRDTYPQHWQAILKAGNQKPPLTLRVNQRRLTVEPYLQMLAHAGIVAHRVGQWAVQLAQPLPVSLIPGFDDGLVSVQDAAAQLAVELLQIEANQRVLDACAAPGGKTGHLLETADMDLTALELESSRLPRITDNLKRLKLEAKVIQGDASQPQTWWDGKPYDVILADVPCTASGIVRRHPDIRWLRQRRDASQLARQQRQIVAALWPLLKPGGKFLYITCSIFAEESVQQVQYVLKQHADARLLRPPLQLLPGTVNPFEAKEPSLPMDHDGLFYALFEKTVV